MKKFIFLALALTSVQASAGYKIVKQDLSSKNYSASITYPVMTAGTVPAALKINDALKKHLVENGCDAQEAAESENGQDYEARAGVVALNANYVGIEIAASSYCGGAHPNHGTYNLTFDSKTGAQVDLAKEIPIQDYSGNWTPETEKKRTEYQTRLAKLFLADSGYMKSEQGSDCIGNGTEQEKIENLLIYFPSIAGLAKGKKVILSLSPPHAAAPCEASIRVDYSKIKNELAPKSKLHGWLK